MTFKEWCKSQGYTQREVAEKTGISKRVIEKYWQGVRVPTRKREKELKEKLNMPSGLFDE